MSSGGDDEGGSAALRAWRIRVGGVNRVRGAILSAIAIALLLSGCGSRTIACAGQCKAPYELQVTFIAGTPITTAKAVLQHCGHEPDVIRVGALTVQNGSVLWGTIWTRHLGSKTNEPLLACLGSSPYVRIHGTGWPD